MKSRVTPEKIGRAIGAMTANVDLTTAALLERLGADRDAHDPLAIALRAAGARLRRPVAALAAPGERCIQGVIRNRRATQIEARDATGAVLGTAEVDADGRFQMTVPGEHQACELCVDGKGASTVQLDSPLLRVELRYRRR